MNWDIPDWDGNLLPHYLPLPLSVPPFLIPWPHCIAARTHFPVILLAPDCEGSIAWQSSIFMVFLQTEVLCHRDVNKEETIALGLPCGDPPARQAHCSLTSATHLTLIFSFQHSLRAIAAETAFSSLLFHCYSVLNVLVVGSREEGNRGEAQGAK